MNIEGKSLDTHWITAINDYERKKYINLVQYKE